VSDDAYGGYRGMWRSAEDEVTRLSESRSAVIDLAKALRMLVNAELPLDLDRERPFWVAARNARAILSVHAAITGIDGEQDPKP
jgi:hypothetical protein